MSIAERIRVRDVEVLSDDRYRLTKTTFDWRRADGRWQTQAREVYDRGDAAALLPCDLQRGTVLLTRQFRYPAYANGHDGLLIEALAGMLDGADPETRIRAEAEEEIGYRLGPVRKVFECFMSPGASTEKLHLFVAEYQPGMRVAEGGGLASEGEDIEVLEMPISEAMAKVASGEICDAKTLILLQYSAASLFAAI
jgi:nudix-type nucleoside diphosphatase (YffH/AdpP family)